MKEMGCSRSRLHELVEKRKVWQIRYWHIWSVQLLLHGDDSFKNERWKKQICDVIFGLFRNNFSRFFFFWLTGFCEARTANLRAKAKRPRSTTSQWSSRSTVRTPTPESGATGGRTARKKEEVPKARAKTKIKVKAKKSRARARERARISTQWRQERTGASLNNRICNSQFDRQQQDP